MAGEETPEIRYNLSLSVHHSLDHYEGEIMAYIVLSSYLDIGIFFVPGEYLILAQRGA